MRCWFITLSTLLILGCKNTPVQTQSSGPHKIIAFTNMKLIDGTGTDPIVRGVMVIENGKISSIGPVQTIAVPEGAHIVDLQGKTIIPGLISNHNHLGSVSGMNVSVKNYTRENLLKSLKQYETYGVTTTTSLGMNADLFYEVRSEAHAAKIEGADVFGADRGIGVAKGAPPVPPEFTNVGVMRPRNAKEARVFVRDMKKRGTDLVKLWFDDFLGTLPKMKPEIYKAVIDEAHKNGLRVAAHVYYLKDAKALARAGVNILAHGIRSGEVDQELIDLMNKNSVAYIPTLSVDESFFVFGDHPEWIQDPFFRKAISDDLAAQIENAGKMKELLANPTVAKHRQALAQNKSNLKRMFDGGVLIGFGTDSGANPWRIPGFAEHHELELMVQARLTPLQALQIATGQAAKVLELKDRGILAPGNRADFVILAKDPSLNILNTRSIEQVWNRGRMIPGPVALETEIK